MGRTDLCNPDTRSESAPKEDEMVLNSTCLSDSGVSASASSGA